MVSILTAKFGPLMTCCTGTPISDGIHSRGSRLHGSAKAGLAPAKCRRCGAADEVSVRVSSGLASRY
jgi:hypothetical protein